MVFRRQRSFRNICTTDSDLCCLSDLAANRSPQFVLHKVEIKALNFHFKLQRNTFGCVEMLTIVLLRALWNNLFKNALSPSLPLLLSIAISPTPLCHHRLTFAPETTFGYATHLQKDEFQE